MSTTTSSLPPPPPNPRFDTLSANPTHPRSQSHHRTDSQGTSLPIQDALSRDFPEVASLSSVLHPPFLDSSCDYRSLLSLVLSHRREDMQLLLEDPDYFEAFFHTRIPQAVELDQAVSHQIEQNLELARTYLSLSPFDVLSTSADPLLLCTVWRVNREESGIKTGTRRIEERNSRLVRTG
jgi:hypothetical protein